jgi:dephospho-CoA kinase
MTRAGEVPKLVFAPAVGDRPCNIHVRVDGTKGACDALLFRDFLRDDPAMRDSWGQFKIALANALPDGDLSVYGGVKQPAWTVLMRAADGWATTVGWAPTPLGAWRSP